MLVRITNRAPFSLYLASVMLGCAAMAPGREPAFIDVDADKLPEGERNQLAAWQPLGVTMEPSPAGAVATQPGVQPGTVPQPPPAPVMAPPVPPAPVLAPPAPPMPPAPFPAPPAPVMAPPAPPLPR